jgi:hypothetical protein
MWSLHRHRILRGIYGDQRNTNECEKPRCLFLDSVHEFSIAYYGKPSYAPQRARLVRSSAPDAKINVSVC